MGAIHLGRVRFTPEQAEQLLALFQYEQDWVSLMVCWKPETGRPEKTKKKIKKKKGPPPPPPP